jgi:hypothetical protein
VCAWNGGRYKGERPWNPKTVNYHKDPVVYPHVIFLHVFQYSIGIFSHHQLPMHKSAARSQRRTPSPAQPHEVLACIFDLALCGGVVIGLFIRYRATFDTDQPTHSFFEWPVAAGEGAQQQPNYQLAMPATKW